jgi:hypothetical protein
MPDEPEDGVSLIARRVIRFYHALNRYGGAGLGILGSEDLREDLTKVFAAELTRAALADPELAVKVFEVDEHAHYLAKSRAEVKEQLEKQAQEKARRSAAQIAAKAAKKAAEHA